MGEVVKEDASIGQRPPVRESGFTPTASPPPPAPPACPGVPQQTKGKHRPPQTQKTPSALSGRCQRIRASSGSRVWPFRFSVLYESKLIEVRIFSPWLVVLHHVHTDPPPNTDLLTPGRKQGSPMSWPSFRSTPSLFCRRHVELQTALLNPRDILCHNSPVISRLDFAATFADTVPC